jgi:phytanoyl-CoA hydroxylase
LVRPVRTPGQRDYYLNMSLDRNQIEEYRDRGFVNVGRLFGEDELDVIGREYDRLVTLDAQTLGNEEDGVYPYRAMMNYRSPDLKKMIQHPALLESMVQLLGEDVRFWWDQGINKSPGAGSYIEWHQDNGYQRGRTAEYVTCWLALDDSNSQNGGLYVVPESHRSGSREHEWRGVHAVLPEAEVETEAAIPLDAKAGDFLIFSSFLVHQTVGNTTADRQRRAWVIQYCRGDQRNDETGEVYDNRPWVVRGGEFVAEPWSERRFDMRDDRP